MTRFRWWSGWRGELVMVLLACTLVFVAFPTVPFGGRTFMTGWKAPGVNGFNPPPAGADIPYDGIRADAGASAWQFDPWAEMTSAAWHDGDIPLWNPDEGMGTPHAAALQTAVFDPLLALVNTHPTPLTWDFSFLLAFCLGAAAMFLFLRQFGLDRLPSLVGTAVFIWSGFFFRYSNNHFFRSYLYLPLLLLLARRTALSRNAFAPVALGVAVAGNLLVGMPEPSMFVLGTLTLYCLFLLAWPPGPARRTALVVRFAAAGALGGALAAPLLLPGAEFLRLSFSAHTADAHLGLIGDPPNHFLRWLMPYVLGLRDGPFAATRNWVGLGAVVAAVGALASPRTLRRHGGWFFAALGAALLAKMYNLPVVRWAGHLPGLSRAIIPVYSVPVAAFCIAVLAAIGVQAISTGEVSRRRFVVLAGGLVVAVVGLVVDNRHLIGQLPPGQARRQLLLAVAAGSATLAGFLFRRRGAALVVAVAIVAELCLLIPRGIQDERIDAFVRPGWLQYLAAHVHDSGGRVFGLDAKLFPNTASAYGLQDIRSLNALYPKRYVDYIKTFIQPEFVDRFIGGPPFGSESRRGETDNNPMFDLTGVRYIVAAGQEPGDLLARDFFVAHPPTGSVGPGKINVAGDLRSVILVQSGGQATLPVPAGATKLAFAVAADGDAVTAAVARASGPETDGSERTVSLRGAPAAWTDTTVDLPPGSTGVTLSAQGRSAVGFATLRFAYGPTVPDRQYIHVASSDGAEVYENRHSLPRALVVPEVVTVPDEAGAVRYFRSVSTQLASGAWRVRTFDPSRTAVVEGMPQASAPGFGHCDRLASGRLSSYHSGHIVVDVESECPGMLVLSDMYYPGWNARVNGKAARIYPTDIAFRGVPVPVGRSTVEFRYSPRTFAAGTLTAVLAALAAGTALLLSGLASRRKSRVGGRPTARPPDGDPHDFETPDRTGLRSE